MRIFTKKAKEEIIVSLENCYLRCDVCSVVDGTRIKNRLHNSIDVRHLRYYIFIRKEHGWKKFDTATFGIQFPVNASNEVLNQAAKYIMQQYKAFLRGWFKISKRELRAKLSQISKESVSLIDVFEDYHRNPYKNEEAIRKVMFNLPVGITFSIVASDTSGEKPRNVQMQAKKVSDEHWAIENHWVFKSGITVPNCGVAIDVGNLLYCNRYLFECNFRK